MFVTFNEKTLSCGCELQLLLMASKTFVHFFKIEVKCRWSQHCRTNCMHCPEPWFCISFEPDILLLKRWVKLNMSPLAKEYDCWFGPVLLHKLNACTMNNSPLHFGDGFSPTFGVMWWWIGDGEALHQTVQTAKATTFSALSFLMSESNFYVYFFTFGVKPNSCNQFEKGVVFHQEWCISFLDLLELLYTQELHTCCHTTGTRAHLVTDCCFKLGERSCRKNRRATFSFFSAFCELNYDAIG